MEIVIEYVLLENFLINLIILKSTALVLKEKGRLFALSAAVGACIAVVLPLFRLSSVGALILQAGLNIVLVCMSFKFKTWKKFLQIFLTFYSATFLYGGVCFFVESYVGTQSVVVMLLFVVLAFFVVKFLCRKLSRKHNVEAFCFDVEIDASGQKSHWKAFLDSGNLLVDPLTQSPVNLINFKVFSSVFPEIDLEDVLRKSEKLKRLKMAHYISFGTIGEGSKILVFQVDCLAVGKNKCENPVLGLSLKNFNQAFGSDIILHNNYASLCR